MSKKSKGALNPKRQLLLLVAVAGVAFVLLLIFQRQTLIDTWDTLRGADIRYVLALPLLQVINYALIGNYYRGMFGLFGANIDFRRSWGVVAAMNFVNQVLPSGGLSGVTYLAYGFRNKLAIGKTTMIQIGRYMFAFGSYALLMPAAFIAILIGGRSEQLGDLIADAGSNWAAIIVLVSFFILMGLAVGSFVNRRVSQVTGRAALALTNWFNKRILRRDNKIHFTFLRRMNDEFHQGTAVLREKGFAALRPGKYMFFSAIVEILIVYASLLAVDGGVGIGVVFLAFVAANIVGVVSVIPGDVGVHEATVILVLVAFGVDEPVAISTTLLYRVFNKVIFLPIGFYFYANILRPALEARQGSQGKTNSTAKAQS